MIDPAHHPGVFQALERFRAFYAELAAAVRAHADRRCDDRPSGRVHELLAAVAAS